MSQFYEMFASINWVIQDLKWVSLYDAVNGK